MHVWEVFGVFRCSGCLGCWVLGFGMKAVLDEVSLDETVFG